MARKRKNLVNLLALLRHPLNGRRRRKYRLKLMSAASEPGRIGAEGPPFTVPSLTRRIAPHISVVAMARNEASRAHDTMRHFCALFDRVVLIDHLSDDSTADIARGYDGVAGTQVVVLRGEDPGYYQSEYMSAVANALIEEGRTDWIFFLDFDEYLPFDDQSAFRQALVDVAMEPVIHGHWLNLALVGPAGGALQEAEVVIGPSVSSFVKIALNARLVAPGVKVAQGNHAVRLSGRDDDEIGRRAFALLHVPIAGPEALRRKVSQGTKALQDTQGKPATQGFHWREIQSKIDRIVEDGALARELAINYGNSVIDIVRSYDEGHRTDRSRSYVLRFAQAAPATPAVAAEIPTFILPDIARVLSEQFPSEAVPDVLEGLGAIQYARLPQRAPSLRPEGRCLVADAMVAASTDVEAPAPTAWMGHIPFLFSLMETLRPRRYVELGTHAGASFFAACQHIRSNGAYGEAVAIDLWRGDDHAGRYAEDVFEKFHFTLKQRFPDTGRFIRSDFSEAASSFEDGSIDLLHIDGLHTYEAVKKDYETWRPKLTSDGVIIFHDTNEYQTDFGVWQFFEEVRHQAPAFFQFRHGHGLGVMAFGMPETNPVLGLLADFAKRPEKIESFYATLSKALWQAALARRA